MKTLSGIKKVALAAIASSAILWGTAAQAVTQLGFALDGSGSIDAASFALQRDGLANAFAALPVNGTVEVTVVQFATGAQQEVGPVLITSEADRNALIAATSAITQTGGGTNIPAAVSLLTNLMTSSAQFNGGLSDSLINVSTDGISSGDIVAAAAAAKAAGIDALTAEAVGGFASPATLVTMVYNPSTNPNDGSGVILPQNSSPPNPLTSAPWVVPVSDFTAFGPVVAAKIQAVVIPEPKMIALLGVGLLALVFSLYAGRRRHGRTRADSLAAA